SKPSVCHAMCVLQELNMVRRTSRREVYLTTEGIHRAVRMNERYSAIKRFLTETLQVSEDLALRDACALEHLLSSASLSAISTYAG
ncbi:MAG: hypothetical protein LBT32_05845, partial [Peptococcaceae bacterium]|nr:hypothetical protein [Peptococcaceae bacterium]